MPVTYSLIASNTLSSSAASVTFSSIPNTFTDLVLRMSARSNRATFTASVGLELNGDSSAANYSRTFLQGDGASVISSRVSTGTQGFIVFGSIPGADQTANTFGDAEIYLPNYLANARKPLSTFDVSENNSASTRVFIDLNAGLYQSTSAITSIRISDLNSTMVSGSSFFLYGIKNS